MSVKTSILTGAEERMSIAGSNCWIRNDSADAVYASASAGIRAGADGVVAIPAGGSAPVFGISGQVYLLGTGSVQLIGSDYETNPFKSSAQSGGSGADDVARAAVTAHAGNTQVHINAKERDRWNELGCPNMLINPDFAVNQRGQTEYTSNGYTVDCWKAGSGFVVSVEDGLEIRPQAVLSSNLAALSQEIGYDPTFGPATFSLYSTATHDNAYMIIVSLAADGSVLGQSGKVHIEENKLSSVTYNSIPIGAKRLRIQVTLNSGTKESDILALKYAKLECASAATRFMPPDPTSELLKCQRYYQIHSSENIDAADLRPVMASAPTVNPLANGNFEYIAT